MAQKHLNVGAYQVLKINSTTAAWTKKIAQILLTWDNAISVTENLRQQSAAEKLWCSNCFTGKRRFGGKVAMPTRYLKVMQKQTGSFNLSARKVDL